MSNKMNIYNSGVELHLPVRLKIQNVRCNNGVATKKKQVEHVNTELTNKNKET